MNRGPLGGRTGTTRVSHRWEQQPRERLVGEILGQRPRQAGHRSAAEILGDASLGNAEAAGDLIAAKSNGELQPENITDFAHG